MDAGRRVSRSRSRPTAWCPSVARCTCAPFGGEGPTGAGLVGGGGAVGQPLPGGVGPQVTRGTQDLVRCVEVELDQALAPDFELEAVHGSTGHVAIAPDLGPPAGVLGRHVGRLVVEAGQERVGLAAAELEAGQGAGDLVGAAGVGPADEALGVVECEMPALPVGEEVDPVDPEAQRGPVRYRAIRARPSPPPRVRRRAGTRNGAGPAPSGDGGWWRSRCGPSRDRGRSGTCPIRGERSRRSDHRSAGGRPLGFDGPGPAVLEAGQEALGQFGPAREVQSVDAGRQLPQSGLRKMRICD